MCIKIVFYILIVTWVSHSKYSFDKKAGMVLQPENPLVTWALQAIFKGETGPPQGKDH